MEARLLHPTSRYKSYAPGQAKTSGKKENLYYLDYIIDTLLCLPLRFLELSIGGVELGHPWHRLVVQNHQRSLEVQSKDYPTEGTAHLPNQASPLEN